MSAIEVIRKAIEEEVFDYTQLVDALKNYKKPRDAISVILRKGQIIRIRKGLYIFGELWRRKDIAAETLADLVYGPSVLSLDFALSLHGLIPEQVYRITSVSLGRSKIFNTPVGTFTYTQQNRKRLSFGAVWQQYNTGRLLLAKPLKALADKIWTDKRFSPVSPSSYSDYLFKDLRIDEDTLLQYVDGDFLDELEKVYASRKILWLKIFLQKKFDKKQ